MAVRRSPLRTGAAAARRRPARPAAAARSHGRRARQRRPRQQAGAPGSGGAIDGSGGAFPTGECPKPVMNSISKLIDCSNGRSHRAQALACTYSVAPPGHAGAGGEAGATSELKPCVSNADCASLPRGYCETSIFQAPVCRSGCVTDSDCERGICACDGDSPGRCVETGCRTDADCGAYALCAPVGGGLWRHLVPVHDRPRRMHHQRRL